jgi:DNA-binding response OmpR family regulator
VKVLIVISSAELAKTWRDYLLREVESVDVVGTANEAVTRISQVPYDVIILDVVLSNGEAGFAVSDYAQYRRPDASVIFVSMGEVFSDGSIFAHAANARAFLPTSASPADIAALVEHYGNLERIS